MNKWVATILNTQRLQYACVHAHMHPCAHAFTNTHCWPHPTSTPTHPPTHSYTQTHKGELKCKHRCIVQNKKTIIICIFSSLAVGICQFTWWCTHNQVISSSISGGTHSRRRFVQLTCISWHSQRGSTFEHANTIIRNNDVTLYKC